MKSLVAAAMILAVSPLGAGDSAAQTDTSSPGSIETTSPLGADFGQTLGNSRIGMPIQGGMSATSPLGADFGPSLGDNSQITPAPFSDATRPAPCTSAGPGAVALSPFDGSGLSPTSGGLSPTTGFTTPGIGAASTASAPCNSLSTSSGVTGSLGSANSAATSVPSANASSPASRLGMSTPATATASPNTKGVTALGTSGLGTTGLGTTGLGSLPAQSASTLQTTNSPSIATQAETLCSGDVAASPLSPGTVTARSLSGGVPDAALSLGSSATDAAERLGGTASVPAITVPCPTTSTMP
jgi:large repetitive protein